MERKELIRENITNRVGVLFNKATACLNDKASTAYEKEFSLRKTLIEYDELIRIVGTYDDDFAREIFKKNSPLVDKCYVELDKLIKARKEANAKDLEIEQAKKDILMKFIGRLGLKLYGTNVAELCKFHSIVKEVMEKLNQ